MRVAKPSAQFLRLGLNLKHGFDAGAAEAQRRCKQTWRNGIPAEPQVGNVKKRRTYIRQSCGAARGLRRLVDTASFITWIWIHRLYGWMDPLYGWTYTLHVSKTRAHTCNKCSQFSSSPHSTYTDPRVLLLPKIC